MLLPDTLLGRDDASAKLTLRLRLHTTDPIDITTPPPLIEPGLALHVVLVDDLQSTPDPLVLPVRALQLTGAVSAATTTTVRLIAPVAGLFVARTLLAITDTPAKLTTCVWLARADPAPADTQTHCADDRPAPAFARRHVDDTQADEPSLLSPIRDRELVLHALMVDRTTVTLTDPDTAAFVLTLPLTLTAEPQKLTELLALDLAWLTVAVTVSPASAIDGDFADRLLVEIHTDASLQLDPTLAAKLPSTDNDTENTTVTLTDPVVGPFVTQTLLTLLDATP